MDLPNRSEQLLMAAAAALACLLVLGAVRASKPGAPARMGAIVAGMMLLLTIVVGVRAHDATSQRSDQTDTRACSPTTAPTLEPASAVGSAPTQPAQTCK